MEIRTGTVFISPSKGFGPQERVAAPIVFPREVRSAVVGITGYTAGFVEDDHHFGRLVVSARHQITFNTVSVTVSLGVRDWSNDWDDEYNGLVHFAVLAELISPSDVPSRTDLIATDAELTQVIQHFRSGQFLDPANVRPDNSIPLFARKPTGVRLWVDYQADSALPPISTLSGELEVVGGTGSVLLAPMANIIPRRESNILRAERGHTLNFVIPDDRCQGTVTLRARAFSAGDPTQHSSLFERTIRFVDVAPLQVHLVGVEDASVTPSRPAPTYNDMRTLLALPEKWYPYGEIADTGYETLTTTHDYRGNVANLDPAGWDDLLDDLSDLRGSSPEIYVAELPSGTPSGDVGGISNFSSAGAFTFGNGSGAAHEIGHCLGREHAPCGGCASPPADPDGDYPQYGPFPRDSIGEFGYDVAANEVLDPAATFDLMGYSRPRWISPYTYRAISGSQPLFDDIGFSMSRSGPVVRGNRLIKPTENLYLQLEIARDRKVERRHSFHYPVAHPVRGSRPTPFTAEILDDKGKPLACAALYHSGTAERKPCGCLGGNCWPVRVRDMIAFPTGARKLVVWEGEKAIYEEDIPKPPVVSIVGKIVKPDGVLLQWNAVAEPPAELRSIVQWEDRPGIWRGVAPRTSATELMLPARRFAGRTIAIRVLTSSGIATGMATDAIEFPRAPDRPKPDIALVGPTDRDIPRILTATMSHVPGEPSTLAWFDEKGAELSGGRMLDTAKLPDGESMVRAVALRSGRLEQKAWLVIKREGVITSVQEVRHRSNGPHTHPHPPREE